ncbi:hypothetical protein [Candidatus Phycorickettsia trachydisci]|nr:hypothetical protein [Candidatus Phycorickettsia trachydisci]
MNFHFKNNFYEMTVMSKLLDSKIMQEKQNIATLNAEIAYITSPKYLSALSHKHLKLQNVDYKQIVKDFQQASILLTK